MRDGACFPVIRCKMTETTMRADCNAAGRAGPWKVIVSEKQVPIGPMSCLEISISRKVVLFNCTMTLTAKGTSMEILEERVNYGLKGNSPGPEGRNAFREAYTSAGQFSTEHLKTSIQSFFATCRLPRYPEFWRCYRTGTLFLGPHWKRSLKVSIIC
jgi:hypothetical protein